MGQSWLRKKWARLSRVDAAARWGGPDTKVTEKRQLKLPRWTNENNWPAKSQHVDPPPFSPSLSRIKTLFKRDWSTLDETLVETCSCFREGRNRLWSLNRHFRCRGTTHWLVDDPNPMAQSNSSQMGCVDSDLYCAIPPDRIWAPINCSLVTTPLMLWLRFMSYHYHTSVTGVFLIKLSGNSYQNRVLWR